MERQVFVYVDLAGAPHLVGRLWGRVRKDKEGATFEYTDAWQQNPNRFSLEPALTLGPGQFHTTADRAMFGAIGDSAPDTWGRVLMLFTPQTNGRSNGLVYTRPNNSGRLFFSPFDTFSMFTSDTFLTPRSMPL
jgi:hypothetical protein